MGKPEESEYDDVEAGTRMEKVASHDSQASAHSSVKIKAFKRSRYVPLARVVESVHVSTQPGPGLGSI